MIDNKTLVTLEYNKVLDRIAEYAVLYATKDRIKQAKPFDCIEDAIRSLDMTEEAYKLLFIHGVSGVELFDGLTDETERAKKGSILSPAELLRVARLLRASRLIRNSFLSVKDETVTILTSIAQAIFCDQMLENEILTKILSEDRIADDASPKLSDLRKKIKQINEKIRVRLNSYVKSGDKYLQDNLVTMRNDRYVIPVKVEYTSKIKGFVHDRSASGSTVYVEPIEILEMNNELRQAVNQEQEEIEEILKDLSVKVGYIGSYVESNFALIIMLDEASAKATWSYKNKAVKPILNKNMQLDIRQGRHPLIDKTKVVPLNVSFGEKYKYLLITGPNTCGKTVTQKLCGLFTVLAMSGVFLPSQTETKIPFVSKLFCDIGDEQSIEQSLSTFSSHMKRIVYITENADEKSMVLIDEIGAGTDPEEGSALAEAIISYLLKFSSVGIITTHYSRLKEFAYVTDGIINASMEFNSDTYEPLYKLNIGIPGSSNAIEISYKLGLSDTIVADASSLLNSDKVSFDKVISEAENTRRRAQEELEKSRELSLKAEEEYQKAKNEREKLEVEKNKLLVGAKAEGRRIISEKCDEADELIDEIKEILEKEEISSGDLIRARTLKNKLNNKRYEEENEIKEYQGNSVKLENLKVGDRVFSNKMNVFATVDSINLKKAECELNTNTMRFTSKISDLVEAKAETENKPTKRISNVKVARVLSNDFKTEINIIGKNVDEAMPIVETYISTAVLYNAEIVRIIHGVGRGILAKAVQNYLKSDKNVKSYRYGEYGEGGNGVTVVTLK